MAQKAGMDTVLVESRTSRLLYIFKERVFCEKGKRLIPLDIRECLAHSVYIGLGALSIGLKTARV